MSDDARTGPEKLELTPSRVMTAVARRQKELKRSLEDVAERLGEDVKQAKELIRGRDGYRLEAVVRLAAAVDWSPAELVHAATCPPPDGSAEDAEIAKIMTDARKRRATAEAGWGQSPPAG